MAHIDTLGAARFTDLSVSLTSLGAKTSDVENTFAAFTSASTVTSYFDAAATGDANEFMRITHIKEFPAIGLPANVVKVPEYGSKTSKQIQGQADSPTMEITLNYIPDLWADSYLGGTASVTNPTATAPKIGDGILRLFRFTLMDAEPSNHKAVANGIGSVKNSSYYFLGKFEALEVTPSLTDALSAKLTITVQSDIRGAYTVGNV